MPVRKRASPQSSVQGKDDCRWHEIWRLALAAEQQPAAKRREFLASAHPDSFVVRQAMAILEASVSFLSAEQSFPSRDAGGFLPQAGMKIGRYRVGILLGAGGAGSVYAAFDEELNRAVAIKCFSRRRAGSSVDRPLREARAASALNHPNIIVIHEVIETGEAAAIVMELVQGVTLRALMERNPKLEDVLDWSGIPVVSILLQSRWRFAGCSNRSCNWRKRRCFPLLKWSSNNLSDRPPTAFRPQIA